MTLKLDAKVNVVVQTTLRALSRREQSPAARALLPSAGKATTSPSSSTSLSHSGAWLAAGWTAHAAIGVDIEAIRPMQWFHDDAVLAAVLHPSEIAWLDAGLPQERSQRGLMSWCRKEALLKAMGIGLRSGFSLADIAHTPDGALQVLPPSLCGMNGAASIQDWRTRSLWISDTDNGHQAALAVAWHRVAGA